MKRFKVYILFLISALGFIGCEDDSASNPSFGDKDIPGIYVTWKNNIAVELNDSIKISPQISPSDGATYKWTLNDEIISTNKSLAYKVERPGEFKLKFTVLRNGIENSRTAAVVVIKPFVPKTYSKKMVGFITRNGSLDDIKWDQITHLIISSALVTGKDAPVDTNFTQTKLDIKALVTIAHNNGVYVLLDVTGAIDYTYSGGPYGEVGFYNTVVDPNARKKLINDVLQFVSNNNIDGVNIYLNNTSLNNAFPDPAGVTDFFNEFVAAIPKSGPNGKFFFTASVPGGWTTGALSMIAAIDRFDWYNLMAIGAADITPVHHASFWSFTNLADTWKTIGLASEKMVMVVPAFGVYYTFPDGVTIDWGNSWKYTAWKSFRDILTIDPNAETKNKIDQDKGIFYDGFSEIAAKAKYVVDNNLGGLAVWSIEQDSKDPAKSLTSKANTSLGN